MSARSQLAAAANAMLGGLDLQVVRRRPASEPRPWDGHFAAWIAEAEAKSIDPNDVGDRAWSDDRLEDSLERHYLAHVTPSSVVLELGPGTGRLSRHLIGRCRELIVADYSRFVCDWLERYLTGRGRFRVVHLTRPDLSSVDEGSVDVVVAHGVFEHIDPDDTLAFLDAFYRVQTPGGTTIFNFDNLMSSGGLAWLRQWRPAPGERGIFRFYHPDAMARLARAAGFDVVGLAIDDSRFATITLRKPSRPES